MRRTQKILRLLRLNKIKTEKSSAHKLQRCRYQARHFALPFLFSHLRDGLRVRLKAVGYVLHWLPVPFNYADVHVGVRRDSLLECRCQPLHVDVVVQSIKEMTIIRTLPSSHTVQVNSKLRLGQRNKFLFFHCITSFFIIQ